MNKSLVSFNILYCQADICILFSEKLSLWDDICIWLADLSPVCCHLSEKFPANVSHKQILLLKLIFCTFGKSTQEGQGCYTGLHSLLPGKGTIPKQQPNKLKRFVQALERKSYMKNSKLKLKDSF